MIVIEGMDNTGKTTLSNKLVEHFGLPPECYIHSPGPDTPEQMAPRVHRMLEFKHLPFIWDRIHCISDQVYAEVLGRENWFEVLRPEPKPIGYAVGYLTPESVEFVRKKEACFQAWIYFLASQPTVIYCRPPIENILKFGDREQMIGVKDKAATLVLTYDTFMSKLRGIRDVRVISYDWTNPNSFSIVCEAIAYRIHESEFSGKVTEALQVSKMLQDTGFFTTKIKTVREC